MPASGLHLRPATAADARLLFEWRNDAETRRRSASTEPVEWTGHLRWLTASLALPPEVRRLWLAELDGEPVATVRADARPDGCVEISYTVAPAWRGRGIAKRAVLACAAEHLAGARLVARIRRGHAASEAVARALGLVAQEDPAAEPEALVEWRAPG